MVLTEEKKKERRKEICKLYREKNKEKIKEKYLLSQENKIITEEDKKKRRIKDWKRRGVINDDFNSLYEYYLNCKFCEECNVELVEGNKVKNHKCLDHNHKTGEFRNVLCHSCNIKRTDIIPLTSAEKCWKYKLKKFILS